MSFKDLILQKTYSSDTDDILNNFYIPILEESTEYYRLAGFFSSTSFAVAARGILGLINNGGKMKMIISPRLNEKDIKTIISSYYEPEKYIIEKIVSSIDDFESEFIKNHLYALGWMITNKMLDIKVAIPKKKNYKKEDYPSVLEYGIFHQKVGILKNSNTDTITFSGSINESAAGWLGNVEEFKVFKSWEPVEEDFAQSDMKKFEKFWNDASDGIRVIEMPKALEDKFIEIAPKDINNLKFAEVYRKFYPAPKVTRKKKISLFSHQIKAIENWIDKDFRGIFEMATGTGKTFTALGCAQHLYNIEDKLVIVISAPYQHLVQQWKKEIKSFGIKFDKLIISGTHKWKNNMYNSLLEMSLGHISKLIIITTHDTFSTKDFDKIIGDCKYDSKILLITDEVHGIGSKQRKRGLTENYDYRLGLSATPKRWFDDEGTQYIYDFFQGVVFEFTLKDAITNFNPVTGKTFLTPYRYIPKFVGLNDDELYEYHEKTLSIIRMHGKDKNRKDEASLLDMLIFARANIIKNAKNKFLVLEAILNDLSSDPRWTIIYCTPQQIDEVMFTLKEYNIIAHRFSEREGTNPEKRFGGLSEREYILENFAEGKYEILVAMKCLDEGVDVPQARKAILMASSGNPREYIQRIGRVIRRYKGKRNAIIYDLIVNPSTKGKSSEFADLENRIFEKEINRYKEIAKISMDSAEAMKLINNLVFNST